MPTRSKSRCALWLAVIACLPSACTGAGGTPTPEPPDFLPTPTLGVQPASVLTEMTTEDRLAPTMIGGKAVANRDVWVVDLDGDQPPQRVRADARGDFSVRIERARSGDRIRVVARTDTQHSAPLDLVITGENGKPGTIGEAPASAIACLSVDPRSEITEVVDAGESYARAFTLRNGCGAAVRVDRAVLRLGDQGMAALPPTTVVIPSGGEARVPVTIDGHADPVEHADILLLDVALGDQPGRYALGVYSVSGSSIGKP